MYKDFIESLGLEHFEYKEFVSLWALHRKMLPPKKYWENIVTTTTAADILRESWGAPLTIRAAYRPLGGAKNSQHKRNRALDVDLPKLYRSTASIKQFREKCAALLSEYGAVWKIGMGFYSSVPWRVHIDTGYRLRDWPGDKIFDLVEKLGLPDPRRKEPKQ